MPVYVGPAPLAVLWAVQAAPAPDIAAATTAALAATAPAAKTAPTGRINVIHVPVVGVAVPEKDTACY